MADGLHCKDCGWYESDHTGEMEYIDEKTRQDDTGFKFSLEACPGFNPRQKEVKRVQKIRDAENAWEGEVWLGRSRTGARIMEDVVNGRFF